MKGVLFVLYIGFSCSCFAQEKGYELGYVVTISNDTIKGLIKKGMTGSETTGAFPFINLLSRIAANYFFFFAAFFFPTALMIL